MKKRSLIRRGLLAGTFLVAGGGSALVLSAGPAGASSAQVTAVGSATTYVIMHNLFPTSLNDLGPGYGTGNQKVQSTAALCNGGITYSPTTLTPNGSTAGRTAIFKEESKAATERGCLDFARSSAPPKNSGTLSTHFDYYAYALDGVGALVGKNAGGSRTSPPTLSLVQITDIYKCLPGYTNWKTLGGSTAPIVRFWPQHGSGTLTVFKSMIGFTPYTTPADTPTCTTKPYNGFTVSGVSKPNEENSEEGIIYESTVNTTAPIDDAIYIYSAGKFSSQWDTTTHYSMKATNSITGTAIGNFDAKTLIMAEMLNRTTSTKTAPFASYSSQHGTFTATSNRGSFSLNTGVVNEANEWFSHMKSASAPTTTSTSPVPGVRYIYNVADTALPTYSEAKMMIGFDNKAQGTKSTLCNGDDAATILASGFIPLNNGSTAPKTSDLAGATCREFPGKSYPGFGGPKSWTPNTWTNPTG